MYKVEHKPLLSDESLARRGCLTSLIYIALALCIILLIIGIPLIFDGEWFGIAVILLGIVGIYALTAKLKDRKKAAENATMPQTGPKRQDNNNSSSYDAAEAAATNLFIHVRNMGEMLPVLEVLNMYKEEVKFVGGLRLTINSSLGFITLSDVIKCYKCLGYDIDNIVNKSMGLLIFTLELMDKNAFKTVASEKLMREHGVEYASNFIKVFDSSFGNDVPEDKLFMIELLRKGNVDKDVINRYILYLHRFVSVMAEQDGPVSEKARVLLDRLMNMINNTNKVEVRYRNEEDGTAVSIVVNNLPDNAEIKI